MPQYTGRGAVTTSGISLPEGYGKGAPYDWFWVMMGQIREPWQAKLALQYLFTPGNPVMGVDPTRAFKGVKGRFESPGMIKPGDKGKINGLIKLASEQRGPEYQNYIQSNPGIGAVKTAMQTILQNPMKFNAGDIASWLTNDRPEHINFRGFWDQIAGHQKATNPPEMKNVTPMRMSDLRNPQEMINEMSIRGNLYSQFLKEQETHGKKKALRKYRGTFMGSPKGGGFLDALGGALTGMALGGTGFALGGELAAAASPAMAIKSATSGLTGVGAGMGSGLPAAAGSGFMGGLGRTLQDLGGLMWKQQTGSYPSRWGMGLVKGGSGGPVNIWGGPSSFLKDWLPQPQEGELPLAPYAGRYNKSKEELDIEKLRELMGDYWGSSFTNWGW